MKKKRNAFTLVELLAVIVILAIILVIAVPKITKVIEQSKKGALESSAKLIAGSLENKYKEELALGTDDISTSTGKTCPASMYDSNLYSCTYTLDSDTGKATVSLIGKTDSKFEKLGVDATTTEATSYKLGESITITFDSQGGSTVESKTLTSGETYGTLATPTKTGVTFKGWYTEITDGTKVASTDIAKSSITLYAHYLETVELSSSWKDTINSKTVGTLTIVSQGASSNIKSIKFYDNSDNAYNATGKTFIANVSTSGETIKAYGVVDSTDTTKIDIDIVGNSLIAFPANSYQLFYNLTNLATLDFNDSIITSNVTAMAYMFCNCFALTSIDLSNFDTSNVKSMYKMFCYCFALASIDVSNFNTSKVTNMSEMFTMIAVNGGTAINGVMYYGSSNGANHLTEIKGLNSFDTSIVFDMDNMFYGCSALTSLDVSNFDTSNVTDMQYMFSGCSSLTSLDVSSFNTSNVTKMAGMFSNCSTLTSLDVSNFNTSNVTDMSMMFNGCSTLTSLDVSNFNTSNVTNMSGMFWNTGYKSTVFTLDVSNFDTSKVTIMSVMFYNTGYNSTKFNTEITILNPNVTSYSNMFYNTAESGSQITVNYTSETSDLVDNMIATKSSTGNVVKGNLVTN